MSRQASERDDRQPPRPLRLTLRSMSADPSLVALIEERATKLQKFYDRLVGCSVVLERLGNHGAPQFEVLVDLRVPGGEPLISHGRHAEARAAIHDAFDASRRRLEDYARRQRGAVKTHREQPVNRPPRRGAAKPHDTHRNDTERGTGAGSADQF